MLGGTARQPVDIRSAEIAILSSNFMSVQAARVATGFKLMHGWNRYEIA